MIWRQIIIFAPCLKALEQTCHTGLWSPADQNQLNLLSSMLLHFSRSSSIMETTSKASAQLDILGKPFCNLLIHLHTHTHSPCYFISWQHNANSRIKSLSFRWNDATSISTSLAWLIRSGYLATGLVICDGCPPSWPLIIRLGWMETSLVIT